MVTEIILFQLKKKNGDFGLNFLCEKCKKKNSDIGELKSVYCRSIEGDEN